MISDLWVRAKRHWTFWGLLTTLLVGSLLIYGAVFLPPRLLDTRGLTPEARLQAENGLRGTLVTLVGGIIVAIGAVIGILNFWETSQQNHRTIELQRRGQLAERFTKAIEQLSQTGLEKLNIRIGAIYALEQIALESVDLHWPVMEVLTAYLRECGMESMWKRAASGEQTTPQWLHPPADVQAAATVIGRRRHQDPEGRYLNLYSVTLEGVDLRGARLRAVDLRGATLVAAELREAMLDLAGLNAATLVVANLSGASMAEAKLGGADLEEARLSGTNLKRADLTGANLKAADLSGANLEGADLRGANLEGADLSRSVLKGAQHLTSEQLQSTKTVDGATLPE